MQLTVDLCWFTLILTGSLLTAQKSVYCQRAPRIWIGALVCTAVLLFPIISWDDDLLRSTDADQGGAIAWTDQNREERGVALPMHAVLTLVTRIDPVVEPVNRLARPTIINLPMLAGSAAGPLGQRPPPSTA